MKISNYVFKYGLLFVRVETCVCFTLACTSEFWWVCAWIFQGATIKTDEETGKIIIARIMHGGAADRSGLIHVGDEVIEVNGINVEGKTPNDVLTILVGVCINKYVNKFKCKYISLPAKLGGHHQLQAAAHRRQRRFVPEQGSRSRPLRLSSGKRSVHSVQGGWPAVCARWCSAYRCPGNTHKWSWL